MTKYEKISVLAKETARSIGENKESWMNYLDVASRLYKYPFEDQILIYAQRPDATACAPLEMWNEKMFCWVNRGAKGIALIDQESDYPRLRYVFDVSDEVSDGVSVADVVSVSLDVSVLSVAFGVDFTSLPSEVTVLVVPSGEVTVEVVLSVVGSGVGAAKENDSGITVINAASSKEINLFFFIIVSLPP